MDGRYIERPNDSDAALAINATITMKKKSTTIGKTALIHPGNARPLDTLPRLFGMFEAENVSPNLALTESVPRVSCIP